MRLWHAVLSDALAARPMVGVHRTIAQHVGGEPTRAELNAGRRAAHTMADKGEAVLVKVVVAPHPDNRPVDMLVLARPDVDVSDSAAVAAAATGRRRSRRAATLGTKPAKVVPALVKTLEAAAATGKMIDLSSVDPVDASRMDAVLTEPLNELTKLRNRLRRRSRTT